MILVSEIKEIIETAFQEVNLETMTTRESMLLVAMKNKITNYLEMKMQ